MLKQFMGAMTLLAGTTFTSCDNAYGVSEKNAKKYMKDRPQKEFLEVTQSLRNKKGYATIHNWVKTQSKLDSVAYRDIFVQTKGIKDSSLISEFNKISAKGIMESDIPHKKLVETNISINDYDKIVKEAQPKFGLSVKYHEKIQYATDSINYRKFFDKHKLLSKDLLEKFNRVCKQIKP